MKAHKQKLLPKSHLKFLPKIFYQIEEYLIGKISNLQLKRFKNIFMKGQDLSSHR